MDTLTKSYFDSTLKSALEGLVTKKYLKEYLDERFLVSEEKLTDSLTTKFTAGFNTLTENFTKAIEASQLELATSTSRSFSRIEDMIMNDRFEIRERLGVVEEKVHRILQVVEI